MKKALMIAVGLLWTLASGTVSMRLEVSEAATISGLCLTEPEFTDFNAMTEVQIREFLADPKKAGGFLKDPFLDVDGVTTVDAASEIWQAAQNNKINPRVLLTTLQKESGAVRRETKLLDDDLRLLAGCGAPTTAKNQIHCMAEQLRRDFDRLSQCSPTLGGWQVDVVRSSGNTHIPPRVTDEPETDAFGEAIAVQPQDKGVTALYQYTPWAGLALGGGHRSFDPNKPERPLAGGNGSFCRLWSQFGFARPAGPLALALSPQPLIMSCAPPTPEQPSRCLSINASGGDTSTGPYTWTNTKGVITITGVNQQNIQLRPPDPGGIPGQIAYQLVIRICKNSGGACVTENNCSNSFTNYGCDGVQIGGGNSCNTGSPPEAFVQSLPCACGQVPACSPLPDCGAVVNDAFVNANGFVFDRRSDPNSCKPCILEMQNVTVTVKDANQVPFSTTVTGQ